MISRYFSLTKPGIIFGNLIVAAAGFFLASRGAVNTPLFIAMMVGLACIIASGCVFNNYIDRDIDKLMERTKHRPLVDGSISERGAIVFGLILLIIGAFVLATYTNALTTLIALTGFFAYVVLYSLWSKRYTIHATTIGTISGAIPPVVGYVAVTNHLDSAALILFLILCTWQIPHAYAIAVYRFNDYAAASIPVMPVRRGMRATKIQMLVFVILFTASALMLTTLGYTGYIYATIISLPCLAWLALSLKGFSTSNDTRWGRQMFFFSLILILAISILMSVDYVR